MTRQFLRFALVGAGNTLVSYGSYAAYLAVGVPYVAASALAFAAGGVNGYLMNSRWTFRANDCWRARGLYFAIQLGALCLNTALVWAAVHGLGVPRLAAYAVAVAPVTVLTFLGEPDVRVRAAAPASARRVGPAKRDHSCHEPT